MLQIYLSVINIASVKYIPKKLMIYNLQDHVLFQYKITLKLKLTQNKQFFEKMDLFVNSKQQFLQTY